MEPTANSKCYTNWTNNYFWQKNKYLTEQKLKNSYHNEDVTTFHIAQT